MATRYEPGVAMGAQPDPAGRSFIEVQFPVSKLSKESYKERKAGGEQTLTRLGKWWGRKPLVLVRAVILGLLLPASTDPSEDRELFLSLMMMDPEGLWRRRKDSLSPRDIHEMCTERERSRFFLPDRTKPMWRTDVSLEDRAHLQRRAFLRMSYDRQIEQCVRVEEANNPSPETWARVNRRLGTNAFNLPELIHQLSERRFGHHLSVGDACSGGGSIPFEAARLGCVTYGSDLNPMAALLTWSALNIIGNANAVESVREAQRRVFDSVQRQVADWGIERNEQGWIAEAYLYCNEVRDPATGWMVPLAASWIVGERTRTIARLTPDVAERRFDIEIIQGATEAEIVQTRSETTWRDNAVYCPVDCEGKWLQPQLRQGTGAEHLRGRDGLRPWEANDVVPRASDVFRERLYCIRWLDPTTGKRYYCAPTASDFEREETVRRLLAERFTDWQSHGLIPSRRIEPGISNNRPRRARGWTHWHHLFNPRQLLIGGLIAQTAEGLGLSEVARAGLLLSATRVADWNSRMCRWNATISKESGVNTFDRPGLGSPSVNYACLSSSVLRSQVCIDLGATPIIGKHVVTLSDAREVSFTPDIWITDPGYADQVDYEESSEFFLAWLDRRLTALFPGWYSDSKRALAVRGKGESFRVALAECYKQLAAHMPDDGFQVVMFTHSDPDVWSDVALVLWSAGLQVTAAWTIATETGTTGIKSGNYVQGTVILVLRKRQGNLRGDMGDLYPDIQAEVRQQLESMLALDPKEDPNFGDADYQLAAYAAALRVMTGYGAIDEIDIDRELRRTRAKGEKSPVTGLIERAVRIASDILVPDGLDASVWRRLGPEERLYLKGIQVEARGESREGVYQELARGYGAAEYREMLASRAANKARLKTPSEFAGRDVRGLAVGGFGGSLLRQVLFAIYTTVTNPDGGPRAAREYLRRELFDYWNSRETIVALLRFLTVTPVGLPHWEADMKAAQLLLGSIENDTM